MTESVNALEAGITEKRKATKDPQVWLVLAYRAGENSQILALAEALNWPYEIKRMVYRKYGAIADVFRPTRLTTVVLDQSSLLTPPWPDLVISAGMRNEPVCRWIRRQSNGRTRIVHVGRPWARPEQFDLIVTTPQYQLPKRPNIVHNTGTLHGVSDRKLAEESAKWGPFFAHLARPYVALVVGGNSGPYTLGPRTAKRLADMASAMLGITGGSLLITTSARTSKAAIRQLKRHITVPFHIYEWAPNAEANPYFGYLALADRIIVTGDSISMLTEACATRKPIYMFDLGVDALSMRVGGSYPLGASMSGGGDFRLTTFFYLLLMRLGPKFRSRDIRRVHSKLLETKRVVWLGSQFPTGHVAPPLDDLARAVARVRRLVLN